MKKNDIVMVISSSTVPEALLGHYGVVTGPAYGDKVFVQFTGKVGTKGTFSHTASVIDLKKMGVVSYE